jgi:aspartyl-tRNA(Asn)/glutamyl-tRNA(Gln) amidotransferase subunit A
MATDDLFFSTIGELNQRLRTRDLSAKEIVHAFGARLNQLGPKYNALALPLTDRAMKAAHDVDADLKRNRFRGPLQGIPWGAKDLLSLKHTPTTWGAKPYANQTFDYTATAVAKLEKKGALLLGKLAMVELAGGPMGYRSAAASLTGPGLNPWDPTRWSGGSSSGSATAVAAGLVTFALGSETVGSILTPCAFCGVTGLRPTYGLVSRYGAMPLSWTLDKIGPIGRTAEDCGLILEAIAGGDDKDSGSAGKSFYYAPQYARDLKEIRAGFAAVDFEQWAAPAARPDFARALDTLRGMGVQTRPAKLPDFPYGAMVTTILAGEAASIFEPLVASGRVNQLADAKQISGFHAAMELPAKEYLKAMRLRSSLQTALRELLSDLDVLVAPARLGPAGKVTDALDQPGDPDRPRPKDSGLTALIAAGNLAGLPALVLPCGFADGLPMAIQIVGRAFTENMLLAIGKEFQNRTDWHKRRPPVATA